MKWTKTRLLTTGAVAILLAAGVSTYIWKTLNEPGAKPGASAPVSSDRNPNTDWFKDAHYGVLMHFLPKDAKGLDLVNQFDVEALAGQLESIGAKYLVFTLGQYPHLHDQSPRKARRRNPHARQEERRRLDRVVVVQCLDTVPEVKVAGMTIPVSSTTSINDLVIEQEP